MRSRRPTKRQDEEWSDGNAYLPDRSEVVREYMTFIDHDLVSPDYSQARILIRHDIESSDELRRAVEELKRIAAENLDSELNIHVTGSAYLNARAVDYMAEGQARSLASMLVVIFALVSLLFLKYEGGTDRGSGESVSGRSVVRRDGVLGVSSGYG